MIRIAVIGGGPAGFMAAVSAAEASNNIEIEIFDKAEPFKTILYTGGGRCNITNATFDHKKLASNYPRGEKFLYSAFSRFAARETIDWFNSHGIELYTQDDCRIFPKSNDANTIREMFLNKARELGIKIRSHSSILKIEQRQDKFYIYVGKNPIIFDKVVISTGGNYRKVEGSGYEFTKNMGHNITELKPALTAFVTKEKWPSNLAGVTIQDVEISAVFKGKVVAKDRGDLLFTHKGVSGPSIFKISSYCAFLDYSESEPLILNFNFVPDKKSEDFEKELLKVFDENSKKNLVNILSDYVPRSLISMLLDINLITQDKKPSQITKEERKKIIKLLTALALSVKTPAPEGEMVTAGGINLDEVNPKTMESKIVKNLYFCGEVLNIDGFTGGFNLQAAWSTGYIAGINISTG
ncbi:MAG: NAD(P)/FAD-dependent oxidoreductase [Candidatus Gastranaerophilales bacterium]|nr:NAD(P)/FAD-dependent oxidoreductase [Candidatus Gastranaerophilales bacterium]